MLLTSFNRRCQSLIGFVQFVDFEESFSLEEMTDFVVCGGGRGWWLNMILSYPARKGEGEALIYIGGWVGEGGGCWFNIISSKAYLVLFLFYLQ